jgi:hypothetical protein
MKIQSKYKLSMLSIIMTTKYEYMTNDEIINQYKINKQKERLRNKTAYEKLKENKVNYRQLLQKNYNYQIKRLEEIKQNEQKYKQWKEKHNIINNTCYYNRMLRNSNNNIIEFYSDDGNILNPNEFKNLQNNMNNLKLD